MSSLSPQAASDPQAELQAESSGHPTLPSSTQIREVSGYEDDWQRWDQMAEQFGYQNPTQAEMLHDLLNFANTQSSQELLMPSESTSTLAINNNVSQAELLARLTELVSQLLMVMTSLGVQFQQQQQQNVHLDQLLTQVLQTLTLGGSGETAVVRYVAPVHRTRTATTKDSFAVLNSKDLKKSHAKGSAEEKLRRAFTAIVSHNEAEGCAQTDKWAVNQNALAELTGCNRPAIKQFLKQYGAEIEAHHQHHGLMPRHNYSHGKLGVKITDVIHW
ncbi:MAG TPA: hypothetical protein V6D19_07400 [Stenomitos sp.]